MKTTNFTMRLEEHQVEKLDYFAKKMGLTRSQLLRNLIACEIDDLALLDKFGILRLGAGVRDLLTLSRNQDDLELLETNR